VTVWSCNGKCGLSTVCTSRLRHVGLFIYLHAEARGFGRSYELTRPFPSLQVQDGLATIRSCIITHSIGCGANYGRVWTALIPARTSKHTNTGNRFGSRHASRKRNSCRRSFKWLPPFITFSAATTPGPFRCCDRLCAVWSDIRRTSAALPSRRFVSPSVNGCKLLRPSPNRRIRPFLAWS